MRSQDAYSACGRGRSLRVGAAMPETQPMFTGIVQRTGRVVTVERRAFGATLCVDPGDWQHRPRPGESIAVDGCCLTVAGGDADADDRRAAPTRTMRFDVIRQTLDVTTLGELDAGDEVNLEHAATPTTLLGGHIVQGHVDGVGIVQRVERTDSQWRLRIDPPPGLEAVIIERGSVALQGVSLTVAAASDVDHGAPWFEVALTPTTLRETTLARLEAGGRVNVEGDYLAKIVVQWLRRSGSATAAPSIPGIR